MSSTTRLSMCRSGPLFFMTQQSARALPRGPMTRHLKPDRWRPQAGSAGAPARERVLPGPFRYDTNAVQLADPVALAVVRGVVDLTEVVFDAAWDDDQEQPGRLVHGPEPVRAAAGQEHEAASRGIEGVAAAPNGQFSIEHVEALVFPVMNVQRRSGLDRGLKDAQGSARG